MTDTRRLLVVVLLAGCGDDGGGSPAIDAPPGGDAGGCSEAVDTCTGETICLAGACVAAFPRVYAISAVRVQAPASPFGGGPWDPDSSGPDLKINITVGFTNELTTPIMPNTTMATFAGPYEVMLTGMGPLIVSALDDDETTDEDVTNVTVFPLDAAALRPRLASSANGPFSMSFQINPK